jgi:poly(beta-D-mannuronate) lyase
VRRSGPLKAKAGTDFAMPLLRMSDAVKAANANKLAVIDPWQQPIAVATRDANAINHLPNNLVY